MDLQTALGVKTCSTDYGVAFCEKKRENRSSWVQKWCRYLKSLTMPEQQGKQEIVFGILEEVASSGVITVASDLCEFFFAWFLI